ncbi:unnamed protein product [Lampetra fluviatilis]
MLEHAWPSACGDEICSACECQGKGDLEAGAELGTRRDGFAAPSEPLSAGVRGGGVPRETSRDGSSRTAQRREACGPRL